MLTELSSDRTIQCVFDALTLAPCPSWQQMEQHRLDNKAGKQPAQKSK